MKHLGAISGVGVYARPHESAIRSAPEDGSTPVQTHKARTCSGNSFLVPIQNRDFSPRAGVRADTSRHPMKTSRRLK